MPTPEDQARETIDDLLAQADKVIQNPKQVNLAEDLVVVIPNFALEAWDEFVESLFYMHSKYAEFH